jgi:hypothetical protein
MMLNSMQVLPVADISQMALLDNRIANIGSKANTRLRMRLEPKHMLKIR